MDITIIGSGTCTPSLHRSSPCIMIDTEQSKILFDTGPGTLRQLLKADTAVNDIDLICYSHFHIDHISDLAPFIFACKYSHDAKRTTDITIAGPVGIKKHYDSLVAVYGNFIVPEFFEIAWIEMSESTLRFNDILLTTAPVIHTDTSIAIRIEDNNGAASVYSGDTDYCSGIIKLSDMADLLILECSFPEHMKCSGHLIPSLAGKIAAESHCRQLILTHLYPPCDTHNLLTPLRQQYSGMAALAEDLMKITI